MTPAVNAAKKARISYKVHEYAANGLGTGRQWGAEAAEIMGIVPERVFKTLIVRLDKKSMIVGLVPVACELNLKAIAAAAGGKKAEMAEHSAAERSTGYVLGGISPLGQRQKLVTLIDSSADNFATIFVSGGRRGLEIELSGRDLLAATDGHFASIARWPE